jgi:hypothetical protein
MSLPRIAIPSLNRQTLISNLTLKYLSDSGYPAHLIDIFVASEAQRKEYMSNVPASMYGTVVVGVLGLAPQRNFITKFYPEEAIYVSMDDDVRSLVFKDRMLFLPFIKMCVKELATGKAGLMGILPNSDKRRMREHTTEHLSHIVGSFFVIKNHHDIKIGVEEKEDYERSILYYLRYGRILRYQGGGVDTKYAVTPGGLQQPGREKRMSDGAEYMVSKYPGLVIRKDKKGLPDIQLNWRHKLFLK